MSNTVPKGWSIAPIGDVCNIAIGGTPSRSIPDYWDSTKTIGSPWVSIRDLNKPWIHESSEWITESGIKHSNVKLVRKGTVLMSFKLSVGRVAFAGRDLYTNEAIAAFLPQKKNVYSDQFLYQGLQHWNLLENIDQAVKGVTLNKDKINQIETLLPPLPEQQKIAAILSSVDDVIEKTRAQIDKLKDLKTGMMQELLTKGIGHTAFKDSPVGRIPEGWDVLPLDSVVKRIIDCEHKTASYVESSEYMVVRTSNVRNGQLVREDMRFTTEGGFNEWTRRAVPSVGDVLFTREAPAGESCMVPEGVKVCMGQRMVLLRPDSEKVYPSYFSLFLTSERAKLEIYELSIGTTVTRINIEDIRRILCIVPPLEEQKAIYSKIQSVQLLISAKEEQEKGQSCMKKALMQDLLTGKVRVNVDNKETAVA